MRALRLVLPFLFLVAAPQTSPLGKLRWLAGCWEFQRGTTTAFEMWMPPAGDLMLGAGRTMSSGKLREYEQLRLTWTGDSLVYHAQPSGQQPADFKGGAPSDAGFTVANPTHDFPQKISYTRLGPDSLIARIEGPGPNGVKGIDYLMKRVSCTVR